MTDVEIAPTATTTTVYYYGESMGEGLKDLYAKTRKLIELLDDAEVNHGGLWSGRTMRARDELRHELSRWEIR